MKKNSNLFWISFSDIMTALFFIMLILFVVSAGFFKAELNRSNVLQEEREELRSIQEALGSLDETYFLFDEENKRYMLDVPVVFNPSEADIDVVRDKVLDELYSAGMSLYTRIDSLLSVNEQAHLLLVIEGNTQRYANNWEISPDAGYRLSYDRALALYNYWRSNNLDFRVLTKKHDERFELIIAGSGYFGLSREEDETLNRRFTLQITSKYTLEAAR